MTNYYLVEKWSAVIGRGHCPPPGNVEHQTLNFLFYAPTCAFSASSYSGTYLYWCKGKPRCQVTIQNTTENTTVRLSCKWLIKEKSSASLMFLLGEKCTCSANLRLWAEWLLSRVQTQEKVILSKDILHPLLIFWAQRNQIFITTHLRSLLPLPQFLPVHTSPSSSSPLQLCLKSFLFPLSFPSPYSLSPLSYILSPLLHPPLPCSLCNESNPSARQY